MEHVRLQLALSSHLFLFWQSLTRDGGTPGSLQGIVGPVYTLDFFAGKDCQKKHCASLQGTPQEAFHVLISPVFSFCSTPVWLKNWTFQGDSHLQDTAIVDWKVGSSTVLLVHLQRLYNSLTNTEIRLGMYDYSTSSNQFHRFGGH